MKKVARNYLTLTIVILTFALVLTLFSYVQYREELKNAEAYAEDCNNRYGENNWVSIKKNISRFNELGYSSNVNKVYYCEEKLK